MCSMKRILVPKLTARRLIYKVVIQYNLLVLIEFKGHILYLASDIQKEQPPGLPSTYYNSALFLFKKSISFPYLQAISISLSIKHSYISCGILLGLTLFLIDVTRNKQTLQPFFFYKQTCSGYLNLSAEHTG